MVDEARLASSVKQRALLLQGVLENVKSKFTDPVTDFVKNSLSQLGGAIGIYYSLFTSLNIVSHPELESLFQRHFHHPSVQDAVSVLEDVEREWNEFVIDVNKQSSVSSEKQTPLAIGSSGPCDLKVQDVRTGKISPIASYLDGAHSLILVLLRHFA